MNTLLIKDVNVTIIKSIIDLYEVFRNSLIVKNDYR